MEKGGASMFKTHKELIEKSSLRGQIEFVGKNRAVKISHNGEEVPLPMVNLVFIPGKYAGQFMGTTFLKYMECFDGVIELKGPPEVPNVEGKEFYYFVLHHGYDYSHHGEPCVTGLFIEASYLEERRDQEINPDTDLYKVLKMQEDLRPPQLGSYASGIDQNVKLEEKIK